VRRKEPTQSVRIRQSDYDILLTLMAQENLPTITDAMSWAIAVAATISKKS